MCTKEQQVKEALFYARLKDGKVRCLLCPHTCVIQSGKRGICRVRENQGGTLISLVYGKVVSCNVDPIEKKPLFHFQPGSVSLSIATVGCNLQCLHCQNYEISQVPADKNEVTGTQVSPDRLVTLAVEKGCTSISYTYTEPTVYFEFALETARRAAAHGIRNVFVTNGYINAEPLELVAPYLHAANVDLKSFTDEFYRKVCKARLAPILDTLRRMKDLGIWVEITTLLIPGLNDSEHELRELARFIRSLGSEVPWHVSAFYPTYRMTDRPRTPVKTLQRARSWGLEEGLQFVYTGNIPGEEGENTFCPGCGFQVITRVGFSTHGTGLEDTRCSKCKRELPLIL